VHFAFRISHVDAILVHDSVAVFQSHRRFRGPYARAHHSVWKTGAFLVRPIDECYRTVSLNFVFMEDPQHFKACLDSEYAIISTPGLINLEGSTKCFSETGQLAAYLDGFPLQLVSCPLKFLLGLQIYCPFDQPKPHSPGSCIQKLINHGHLYLPG
jgi:hypothetical protein